MTTASGFNVGFNDNGPPLSLKDKDMAFPLSPIKEQISRDNLHRSSKNNNFNSS